ncbi:MAG: hypothetical protein CMF22_11940 [Idiomarinaceae bacterium]|nr:hypothetical protein [Idiomarinaceae bacterium]|tara:strand:+ start:22408 stop:22617 length:210 start_codon:yes stop_codon:yes gene_type:complete
MSRYGIARVYVSEHDSRRRWKFVGPFEANDGDVIKHAIISFQTIDLVSLHDSLDEASDAKSVLDALEEL